MLNSFEVQIIKGKRKLRQKSFLKKSYPGKILAGDLKPDPKMKFTRALMLLEVVALKLCSFLNFLYPALLC